jgi:hypothetical protein
VVRVPSGPLVVNPGSVGLPAYDDVLPFPHVIGTVSPDARYALLERHALGWTVSLLSVPYAYAAMARLAESRNRPDWAHALATGYML